MASEVKKQHKKEKTVIDTNTVKFISLLNQLAEKSKNGIKSILEVQENNADCIVYDISKKISNGYPVVAPNYLIDDMYREVTYTHTKMYDEEGLIMVAMVDEENPYISVTSKTEPFFNIVIENGKWYCT